VGTVIGIMIITMLLYLIWLYKCITFPGILATSMPLCMKEKKRKTDRKPKFPFCVSSGPFSSNLHHGVRRHSPLTFCKVDRHTNSDGNEAVELAGLKVGGKNKHFHNDEDQILPAPRQYV
jgi:hypothetical protein